MNERASECVNREYMCAVKRPLSTKLTSHLKHISRKIQ